MPSRKKIAVYLGVLSSDAKINRLLIRRLLLSKSSISSHKDKDMEVQESYIPTERAYRE